jgi:hypothetical protein
MGENSASDAVPSLRHPGRRLVAESTVGDGTVTPCGQSAPGVVALSLVATRAGDDSPLVYLSHLR